MKVSSYPVLNNRPIDQWKVTELKDELKRRKLVTRGLKEELIRRLNEDIRNEMESSNQEEADNGNDDNPQPKCEDNADEATLIASESVSEAAEVGGGPADGKNIEIDEVLDQAVESVKNIVNGNEEEAQLKGQDHVVETLSVAIESVSEVAEVEGCVDILVKDPEDRADGQNTEVDDALGHAVKDDNVEISDQNLEQQAEELTDASPAVKDSSLTDEQSVEVSNAASENTSSEAALAGQGSENELTGNKNSDSSIQLDAEDIKPSDKEVKHIISNLNNQVSEVSSSLGFPVKNDYVSSDSMHIDEKNELKDNIIADDVKLEIDVKHEMVQPSSSPLVPDGGKSRPMDVEEPQIEVSVDGTEKTVNDEDMSKKNYSADLGSPEKISLDRSSGDDSMEEDTLENKQVDSAYNPVEVGGRVEKTDVSILKEETTIDAVADDLSAARKDGHVDDIVDVDDKVAVDASTEKRKLPDNQEALANNEPSKRQRRWKTESVKATESVKPSEPLSSSPAMSTTPRGTPQALGSNRSFSRSNSNADDDEPKERFVPPPVKPPTDSLRIDNFLRPFTLKAVQELLGKSGTVASFWMDHIKTHCYVTYSSVEEATETRNAVYNLKWPSNGGRLLVAEFVDAEEVKSHAEAPKQPPTPIAPANAPPAAPVSPLQPSPHQLGPRQKQLLQTNLPPPPPLTNPPPVRERLQPPPPPPLEKVDPPVVTLDDLFRKTKTTPRIYYLPLSEESVNSKLEAQRRSLKQ